jgi:predicted MPP superfamily phosphohydrolase
LRVVQVTDLHFGYVRGSTYLDELATALQELQPDLVVLTGDMLDVALPRAQPFIDALAAVRPPLGKFAVLGNHEYYVRVAKSVPLLEAAGCSVLRGTNATIDAGGWPLLIAGVDDPAGRNSSQESRTDEASILPAAGDARHPFTLLLKHQPRVANTSRGRFDLQLSGHTHGGQLFPFHFMVRAANQYFRGMYGIAAGGQIYVGHGAGTWGPPLRHCAPREITLFILTPKS